MQWTSAGLNRIRELVLQSAGRLFNRHGFNAVLIDDVMAEAGLTRGSFYCYFSSKSDLYAHEDRENPKANGSERVRADKIVRDYLSVGDHEETGDTFPMIGRLTTFRAPIARSGKHSNPRSS
jgi:TetR/AcrR family transcriptional repressor of nem operon